MTEQEIRELEIACAVARGRTEQKIKERKKRIGKHQMILMVFILLLISLYVQ